MLPILHSDPSIGRGFDRLAWIYDSVVQLIFGQTFEQLQAEAFATLPACEHTLIVGGGSGKIVRQCFDHGISERYTYAELSEQMIGRTKRRLSAQELQNVTFTQDKDAGIHKYDLIILPFILDCYDPVSISTWLNAFQQRLNDGTRIVLIDFNMEAGTPYQPKWWKAAFIRLLYAFFRSTTRIPAKELAPFQRIFQDAGFRKESEIYAHGGWIQAVVWTS